MRLQSKTSPYFSICTLNKTFSLEEEAQNRGGNLNQKLGGNLSPKLGGGLHPDFDSRFGEIEATANNKC